MKNHYTISDDGATITVYLKRRSGERLSCLIDASDLPKLQTLHISWHAGWDKHVSAFYARGNVRINGKRKTTGMHRFLTDTPDGLQVDHLNHNTLDNRRCNLRLATNSQNLMNRKGADKDSQTGERGISPYPLYGKFRLALTVNGRQRCCGYFATIEEAIAVRNQFQEYSNG
ncbi:MAG: HNH endonuclease [Ktedonobacteraceae bacterium]